MATRLKMYLVKTLRELLTKTIDQLLDERYLRFRQLGVYLDEGALVNDAVK